MRKADIKVGFVYSDGVTHRLVQDEGPQYGAVGAVDTDCISYVRLDGKTEPQPAGLTREGLQISHSSRRGFASWARREMTIEAFAAKVISTAQADYASGKLKWLGYGLQMKLAAIFAPDLVRAVYPPEHLRRKTRADDFLPHAPLQPDDNDGLERLYRDGVEVYPTDEPRHPGDLIAVDPAYDDGGCFSPQTPDCPGETT